MGIAKIELQQRMISLESSALSNTLNAVTDRLPGFVADVSNFIKGLFNLEQANNSQLLGDRKAHAMVKSLQYTQLMPLMVYTPPGLSVPYTELVSVLEQSERIASSVLKEALLPFNKWIALQLANPDRLISISGSHISGIELHDIETATRKLANCFKNSVAQTEVKFGDVIKRVSDFESIARDLNDINDRALQTTPSQMREVIESITANLDRLVQRMQEDPETYKASGAVVKTLADTAFAIAKECEFYSVFMYQLKSTLQAFRDTEEAMEKSVPSISNEGIGNIIAQVKGHFVREGKSIVLAKRSETEKAFKEIQNEINDKYGNPKWLSTATFETEIKSEAFSKYFTIEGKVVANPFSAIKSDLQEFNFYISQWPALSEKWDDIVRGTLKETLKATTEEDYIAAVKVAKNEIPPHPINSLKRNHQFLFTGNIIKETSDESKFYFNAYAGQVKGILQPLNKDTLKEAITLITNIKSLGEKLERANEHSSLLFDHHDFKFNDELEDTLTYQLWHQLFYWKSRIEDVSPVYVLSFKYQNAIIHGLMSWIRASVK